MHLLVADKEMGAVRDIAHGSLLRYGQGCRCSSCILAEAARDQERTSRRHGISAYNKHGCRCDECRAAAAAARRKLRYARSKAERRLHVTPQLEDLSWQEQGACKPLPVAMFFPATGRCGPAKAVCNACPVRVSCLDYALRTHQDDGIWGGLTSDERRRVQRKRRRVS